MQLNPEHFHLPCKKPHNRSQSPFTPVPSHWQSPKSTVCMQNVCILGISFKWTHTVCGLLCLAQFLKRRNIYACLPYVIYFTELSVQIFAHFFNWVAFLCSSSRVIFTFCIQAPLCVLQVFFSNLWLTFHFFKNVFCKAYVFNFQEDQFNNHFLHVSCF